MLLNNGQQTTRYFIGIDGGGTKTSFILGNDRGQIIATSQGSGSNIKSKPWSEVTQVLMNGIDEVMQQAGCTWEEIHVIFFGLAGSDRADDKARWHAFLAASLPAHIRYVVHNDAVCALAAGTWGEGGIVLIAGTGSIATGYNPATGRTIRVGGWGYLLGDEGSGFDLGRQAIIAVMRAYDGRGERTALSSLLLQSLQLDDESMLINYYYNSENIRQTMAAAAKLVLLAAEQGDAVARTIADNAIASLVELASTAARRLFQPSEANSDTTNRDDSTFDDGTFPLSTESNSSIVDIPNTPLVLSGGIFNHPWFSARFTERVNNDVPSLSLRRLLLPPAIGSYVLAMQEAGLPITESMKQRIKEHYNEQEDRYD